MFNTKHLFLLFAFLSISLVTQGQNYDEIRTQARQTFTSDQPDLEDIEDLMGDLDDNNNDGSFSGINYPSHNFDEEHLENIVTLCQARALIIDGTPFGNLTPEDLELDIHSALTWWYQNVADHDPIAMTPPVGWWKNEIGKQRELQKISVLFYDYLLADHLDANGSNIGGFSLLEQINQDFQEDLVEPDDPDEKYTGANKADIAATIITKGLLIDEIADDDPNDDLEPSSEPGGWLTAGRDHMACTMRFSTLDQDYDGIREDYSFQQHNRSDGRGFLYTGGYGQSFVHNVATWGAILMKADDIDTEGLDYDFADTDKEIFFDFLIKGYRWTIIGNTSDYSTNGRYIVRKAPNNTAISVVDLGMVMDMAGDAPQEIQDALQLIASSTLQITDPNNKNKFFWQSDYVSHHESNYFSSLRMCSERTVGTESTGGENIKGFWLPFGCTFIYQDGKEYVDLVTGGGVEDPNDYPYIFPIMDWSKIPGVTSPAYVPEFNGCDGEGIKQNQSRTFVGSTGNGIYSVSAMDYRKSYDSNSAPNFDINCNEIAANMTNSRIKSKKAWFHFGEEIIALGAGIEDDSGLNAHTTLNQCLGVTTPINDDTAPTEELTHDGVAYIAPPYPGNTQGSDIMYSYGTQSGSWFDIDDGASPDPLSGGVFSAWISHGNSSEGNPADYFYIIVPGQDAATYADNNSVEVIVNEEIDGSYRQAVRKDNLVGIVNYPDGNEFLPYTVNLIGGDFPISLRTDRPCVLFYDNCTQEVCISSPDRGLINSVITLTYQRLDANGLPTGNEETLVFDLPDAEMEGTSLCRTLFSTTAIIQHHCPENNIFNGVVDVEVKVTGSNSGAGQNFITNDLGEYDLPEFVCSNGEVVDPHEIRPYRNNTLWDGMLDGVDAADILAISNHISGAELLDSPYKIIAADVFRNEVIDENDIDQIQKGLLFDIPNWVNNNSWGFVPQSYVFPNPSDPFPFPSAIYSNGGVFSDGDFWGIKIGDVNCSITNGLVEPPCEDEVNIFIEDRALASNEIFTVALKTENFNNMEAYQFALDFAPDKLEYISIHDGDLNRGAALNNFGLKKVANGKIRTLWLQDNGTNPTITTTDTTLVDSSSLFLIEFKALEPIAALSDVIELESTTLKPRAWSSTSDCEHEVKLEFVTLGVGNKSSEFINNNDPTSQVRVYPNPTKGKLIFDISTEEATGKTIQIFNSTGAVIYMQEVQLEKGNNVIQLDNITTWESGLYYYTITDSSGSSITGKFVKQEE